MFNFQESYAIALMRLYNKAPLLYNILQFVNVYTPEEIPIPESFKGKVKTIPAMVKINRATLLPEIFIGRKAAAELSRTFIKANPNGSVSDAGAKAVAALLHHELLHIVYAHLSRKDPVTFEDNMAQDYVINHQIPEFVGLYPLIRTKLGEFRKEVISINEKHLGADWKTKIEKRDFTEEQATALNAELSPIQARYQEDTPLLFSCTLPMIEDREGIKSIDFDKADSRTIKAILFPKGNSQKVTGQDGDDLDCHDSMEDLDEDTKAQMGHAIESTIKQAMRECKRTNRYGTGSANLDIIVQSSIKSRVNYHQIIQNFANSVRYIKPKRSWVRRHRRYPTQTPGHKVERKPNIVFLIDTSGSMFDDGTLGIIHGQLKALLNCCKSVYIVMGDTNETARIDASSGDFDLRKMEFKGGGGTHLQFGWDAAKELNADGVLCQTDGYMPEINDYGIPSIFSIYPGGTKFAENKYKNILIEDCK